MSKGKIPPEEKIKVVKLYLKGKKKIPQLARIYKVSQQAVHAWIRNYESMGAKAFDQKKRKNYPAEIREKAVQEYLDGQGSLARISKKYGIRSKELLRYWIQVYSCHEILKFSDTGRSTFMTKGRATTFNERIEIVQYCLQHDNNYTETAEKYGISYQQARNYTLKYKERGVEGLKDRREKRKDISEMTKFDLMQAEIRQLREEVRRGKMQELLLKKLMEIERRRD